MGLLNWLRGDADNPSSTMAGAALTELDAELSPAKRQQIENLDTLEMLREEEGQGADDPRKAIDLESGVARVRLTPKDASSREEKSEEQPSV